MTDDNLARIKAYCDAATAGPWHADERCQCAAVYAGEKVNCFDDIDLAIMRYQHRADETESANMVFIANARTDLPLAVTEIERLRAVESAAVKWLLESQACLDGGRPSSASVRFANWLAGHRGSPRP